MKLAAAPSLTWIERLGLTLFRRERPDAKFMLITAYLDESGTHGEASSAVVMAGYIGSVAQWAAWEAAFNQLLSDYGVKIFHAKKFRHHQGEFKGWSKSKRIAFHAYFTKLIDENLEQGFFATLTPSEYRTIYKDQHNPKKIREDTQYGMCFRACLWFAANWIGNHHEGDILNLVLECGHPNAPDTVRIFDEFRADLKPEFQNLLGTISFDRKDSCPPLACADALAHSAHVSLSSGQKGHAKLLIHTGVDPTDGKKHITIAGIPILASTLTGLKDDLFHKDERRLAFGRRCRA